MIVSVTPHPPLSEFQKLMFQTDRLLNADALKRPKYYATRGGNPLEDDVKEALVEYESIEIEWLNAQNEM